MRYSQRSRLLPFRRGEAVMELKGGNRMPRRGIPNEFLNGADAMECEAAASFPEPPPRLPLPLHLSTATPLASARFLLLGISSFSGRCLEKVWCDWSPSRGFWYDLSYSSCLTNDVPFFFFFLFNNDYCSRRVIHSSDLQLHAVTDYLRILGLSVWRMTNLYYLLNCLVPLV